MSKRLETASYLQVESDLQLGWTVQKVSLESYRSEIVGLITEVGLSTADIDKAEDWFVVEDKEKVIGCMALEKRGLLVHIQSLSVAKKHRKRGVARSLVEYGFERFVMKGEAMTALTLFWNMKIYQSLDFVRVDPGAIKNADDVARREKHKYCVAMVRLKE